MFTIKTEKEIEAIRMGGKILAGILEKILKEAKVGTNSEDLENMACKLVKEAGGRPAFKNYNMGDDVFFPNALCVSINSEVVHGAATPNRELKSGDVIGFDIGMEWPISKEKRKELNIPDNKHSELGGYYSDMSRTIAIGKATEEASKLMKVTKQSLMLGIDEVKPGNTLNDIGTAIQKHVESHGFSVVRELVGHGVGHQVHEDPAVVNYSLPPKSSENMVLKKGMVIAIEPMVNAGKWKIKTADDGYSVLTNDGSLSAHFEHTIAVTKTGHKILTAL